MTNKETKFIPIHSDLMFKNLFGTKKNIKYTIDFLESLYLLKEGTLKGAIIENNSTLNRETILNKDFVLGSEVVLLNKDKIGIEVKKIYKENKKFIQLTGLYYSSFEKEQKINLPQQLDVYKESKIVEVCYLKNKKKPEDITYKNSFNIIIINITNDEKIAENEKLEKWLKFISATSLEELKEISKNINILKEAYQECKKFMSLNYVQQYYKNEIETEKIIEQTKERSKLETTEEIAIKMLENKEPLDKISNYTSISIEEIEELKKEIEK